jgi:hypothetical protein
MLLVFALVVAACSSSGEVADTPGETYRLALVALVENPDTRASFEDGLATKLRASNYDAVSSHDIVPTAADLDNDDFVARLAENGIQGIVMMRPAAIGPESSLDSVRNEMSEAEYEDMRAFAREISPGKSDEVVAVVHTAFYMLDGDDAEMLSSGAVWLDEPPVSREDGIGKLQDLIVANMNRARPAVRQHLGLPPIR